MNVRTGAKRPVDSGIGERTNDCPGPSDQWGTSDQWAPRGLPTFFSVVEQAVLHTVAPGGHATSISGWMASRAAKSGTLAEQLAGTDGSCAMALPSRQAASRREKERMVAKKQRGGGRWGAKRECGSSVGQRASWRRGAYAAHAATGSNFGWMCHAGFPPYVWPLRLQMKHVVRTSQQAGGWASRPPARGILCRDCPPTAAVTGAALCGGVRWAGCFNRLD